jgi:hypothetical protein
MEGLKEALNNKMKLFPINMTEMPYLSTDLSETGLKPDVSLVWRRDMVAKEITPFDVVAVGELKNAHFNVRSTKDQNDQIFRYCDGLLKKSPFRTTVWAFLTNLKQVIFFHLENVHGQYDFVEYPLLNCMDADDEGFKCLLTFLLLDPDTFGLPTRSIQEYEDNGMHFEKVLGHGAQGTVYQASLVSAPNVPFAVKIFEKARASGEDDSTSVEDKRLSCDREKSVLKALEGVTGVPKLATNETFFSRRFRKGPRCGNHRRAL